MSSSVCEEERKKEQKPILVRSQDGIEDDYVISWRVSPPRTCILTCCAHDPGAAALSTYSSHLAFLLRASVLSS